MINCTPFQAAVELTLDESQLLNQIVGCFAVSEDLSRQTQVRTLAITWSAQLAPSSPSFALRIQGHACRLSLPCVSSLPRVQQLLEDIPWSTLDQNLQLAALSVAFQDILDCLDCSNIEVCDWHPDSIGVEDWTFQVQVEWLSGARSGLFLTIAPCSLAWLAGQLRQLSPVASQDLGWLPVEADVVYGTTELAMSDVHHLSSGDKVLFTQCGALVDSPIKNAMADTQACQVVFREISLALHGQLQAGEIQRVARMSPWPKFRRAMCA